MLVGAKVCDLTEGLLCFVCALYTCGNFDVFPNPNTPTTETFRDRSKAVESAEVYWGNKVNNSPQVCPRISV